MVIDSNAQMPAELVERFGFAVVPLTVTVDNVEHREGIDLSADDFYARFEGDHPPTVSTSQPSPGAFDDAYRDAFARGATQILSVHIGSQISGTVNSARIAAQIAPVPVRIVDTATASFAVTLCAWRAAEAVASGADMETAAAAAEALSATVGNVFVVGGLDLARGGGRLAAEDASVVPADGVSVLTLADGAMRTIGSAGTVEEAAAAMVSHVRGSGASLRVGVGWADAGTSDLVDAVEHGLRQAPEAVEVVRYRIGPSVGAHTGPGTVGVMFCPA